MDRNEVAAITKILEWALTQMKHLEGEAAALEQTLQNYPVVIKERLDANLPFQVEEQVRFLQVAVELARNSQVIQGPIRQKYDTYLARIRERPVSLDEMELALKAFVAWKPSGPVN